MADESSTGRHHPRPQGLFLTIAARKAHVLYGADAFAVMRKVKVLLSQKQAEESGAQAAAIAGGEPE